MLSLKLAVSGLVVYKRLEAWLVFFPGKHLSKRSSISFWEPGIMCLEKYHRFGFTDCKSHVDVTQE